MLRVIAALLALVAVACMSIAIVGIVTGKPGDRAGWALRATAVLCFLGAVALNSAAHH
jgi:VIT1/CCC1 family predicted Fe2+/Mn2+ transporter